ncbi:MAG TPA: hypothetical protein VK968_20575 [Roseimicrobium sp.]|nr:hypothetical protein [Roseimicrobium sp.]
MKLLEKFIARFFTETRVQTGIPMESSPAITLCNEFTVNFCNSDLAKIEVSPEEIGAGRHEILSPLAVVRFDTIRNRFRVLSNADHVSSRNNEYGCFKLSYRVNEGMKDIYLYLRFPPARTGFTISKTPET